jgi:hypothetical protein
LKQLSVRDDRVDVVFVADVAKVGDCVLVIDSPFKDALKSATAVVVLAGMTG